MYWPVGPATAFEQQLPTNTSQRSNDGLEPVVVSRKDSGKNNDTDGDTPAKSNIGHGGNASKSETVSASEVNGLHTRRQSRVEALGHDDGSIYDLAVSKAGHIFATVTRTTLTVWQAKPAVVLTSLVRSVRSLKSYGPNVAVLIRPDADIIVVQSANGYLITYSLLLDVGPAVYQIQLADGGRNHRRRSSVSAPVKYGPKSKGSLGEGGGEVREGQIQFRMVIRLDAGISKALALDHELIVITKEPAAVQCIRWAPDRSGAQFKTQGLADMPWLEGNRTLAEFIYDKPMKLFAFVSEGGRAYAVQRSVDLEGGGRNPEALLEGHIFHIPRHNHDIAVKAAINSRFSLIAVGCTDASICLYSVQNYAGGIHFLQKLPLPVFGIPAGRMTSLCYSPDGYCLFAGYENGWATWSVYGQLGGGSFGCDIAQCKENGDSWLMNIKGASWMGGGSNVLMITPDSNLIWSQEFARSAITGCFNPANVSRGLLHTHSSLIVYRGEQMTDLATITADASVWQHVQAPANYLIDQWPIRAAVISSDRRYVAIAGRRGLAHYSMASGRWRTFQDPEAENDFAIRGGMCWHHHVLIAAVETSYGTHELRLYSRELPLENSRVLHSVDLSSPVVNLSTSGDDGVLVYGHDNTLDHYIVDSTSKAARLVKMGQIALSGIIRSPARVRAVSWIVPDHQLQQGEASQDVASASVLFLIDAKLVLLQPSIDDNDQLKYDMHVIASNIEYFALARDDPAIYAAITAGELDGNDSIAENMLKDSLWAFDGRDMKVWPDIGDLLSPERHELHTSIAITVDFYPFSAPLQKGLIVGAEAELTQRRDVNFSYFRTVARTTLFLPAILRYYLTHYDIPSALRLSTPFQHLPYFSHALEMLLHTVLDEEVEKPATAPSTPMSSRFSTASAVTPTAAASDYLTAGPGTQCPILPTTLAFLANFPNNLDIILQCTRKTELRSWRTLFAHLPPPVQLFEQALQAGDLKTAGGYLLVLQQHQEVDGPDAPSSPNPASNVAAEDDLRNAQVVPQAVRLLRKAQEAGDWELCKELARFLVALDASGGTLRRALEEVERGGGAGIEGPESTVGMNNGLDALGLRGGHVDCGV